MKSQHVGFFLEQAYGHIMPTLGISLELIRRGHRVSYAVRSSFEPLIRRLGARAVVFTPMDTRTRICEYAVKPDGRHDFDKSNLGFTALFAELKDDRTRNSVRQLDELYADDIPDLVIHDDCLDEAGRQLAGKWQVPKIFHDPIMLCRDRLPRFRDDDQLILVTVPKFFNEDTELFDERFKYVGFIAEGREGFGEPWQHFTAGRKTIVACPTTGFMPPIEFCKLIARAFERTPWTVVLTVPGDFDALSAVGPGAITDLPENVHLNRHSSTLEVLKQACLMIGQGGQGSTLEALYSGVPALLIPPSPGHECVANRCVSLGLGVRLPIGDVSRERLREAAAILIEDRATLARVKQAQGSMRADPGAKFAVDLIEERLSRSLSSADERSVRLDQPKASLIDRSGISE